MHAGGWQYSVGGGTQAIDGSGGVVAHIQAAIGSGDRVNGAAPATAIGVLEAGHEGDRRHKRLGVGVPGHPQHGRRLGGWRSQEPWTATTAPLDHGAGSLLPSRKSSPNGALWAARAT